jgi:tetratricopeptide (TPR) repeat protein
MATATFRQPRSFRTRLLAIVGAMLVVVVASQVAVRLAPAPATTKPAAGAFEPTIVDLDPGTTTGSASDDGAAAGISATADVARIRANIEFWSARVKVDPDDFISSNRLGISEIELARSTGDLSAFARAEAAFAITLKRDPKNAAALGYRGSVLVSLHRFDEAATQARAVLQRLPNDPVALATLGDASLELGDIAAARDAYTKADAIARSAATTARLGHLAFIAGDGATAVANARAAVTAADEEGADGERAAFFRYQLADVLISTGDRAGAEKAYTDALAVDKNSFLAHSGLARADAADGDLDAAITQLSAAIAIVPQPEFLARRGDLYSLRAAPGDAKLAAADYDTVEAIAQLAGEAASVYDRSLALYLANHGLDADRAVKLAGAELERRKDVYGYDAYAWTLLAAGRADEADAAMQTALAFGTVDAKLLYHAGMIDAALGRTDAARTHLQSTLDLDPSFDQLQVARARETLADLR